MFKKLRTVIYHVGNLEDAKKWYTDIIGIAPYFDEPFYVGFDINGSELGLDPDMTGVTEGNHAFTYWSVEDIETSFNKLVGMNAGIIQPVTGVGGGLKVAVVNDPWGNAVGLIEGA